MKLIRGLIVVGLSALGMSAVAENIDSKSDPIENAEEQNVDTKTIQKFETEVFRLKELGVDTNQLEEILDDLNSRAGDNSGKGGF